MTTQAPSPNDLPDWWKRLTPDEQASVRRALGKSEDWQPIFNIEVERQYGETRERIREIELRALGKKRPDKGNDE